LVSLLSTAFAAAAPERGGADFSEAAAFLPLALLVFLSAGSDFSEASLRTDFSSTPSSVAILTFDAFGCSFSMRAAILLRCSATILKLSNLVEEVLTLERQELGDAAAAALVAAMAQRDEQAKPTETGRVYPARPVGPIHALTRFGKATARPQHACERSRRWRRAARRIGAPRAFASPPMRAALSLPHSAAAQWSA
jgi:hypothetical protein